MSVCRPLVGSLDDAEDCAAEALAALVEPGIPPHVRDERAWLITIAKRRAVDLLRQRERHDRRHARLVQCTPEPVTSDVAHSVTSAAGAEWLLRQAKDHLPAASYAVVRAMADGQDTAETAQRLGLTRRSVESHLHRARKVLRPLATSALAAVSWVVADARRWVPTAGGTVAVSLTVATVLLPVLDPDPDVQPAPPALYAGTSDEQPPPPRTRPVPATSTSSPPDAVVIRSQQSGPVTVAAPPAPAGAPARTSRTLAQVQPLPDQRAVTIVEEDRGGASDPVGGTLKCLRETRVTLEHIGC